MNSGYIYDAYIFNQPMSFSCKTKHLVFKNCIFDVLHTKNLCIQICCLKNPQILYTDWSHQSLLRPSKQFKIFFLKSDFTDACYIFNQPISYICKIHDLVCKCHEAWAEPSESPEFPLCTIVNRIKAWRIE